jgi:rubredoxin
MHPYWEQLEIDLAKEREEHAKTRAELRDKTLGADPKEVVPMLLWCPECGVRHVDEGEFATKLHHTHACQDCGHVWRPAIIATRGVQFLPGFRSLREGGGT